LPNYPGAAQPGRAGLPLVGAVAGHALVLALVLVVVPTERIVEAVRPMAVRLIELAPEAPKPAPPEPVKPIPRPARPMPVVQPLPVLAVAPVAEAPAPAAFTVAPPPPAPPVAAPPAPPAELPVTAARFDADYLHNPKPAYPPASRRLGEEGKVLLRVYVSPDGQAEKVELKASSGFARLDTAAQDAVARWRFVPARRGDQPLAAWVVVPITFSLES
jgi:protein TonB